MKHLSITMLSALLVAAVFAPRTSASGYDGYYFGSFAGVPGEWAMLAANSNFEFIGFLPEREDTIESYYYGADINDDGTFIDHETYLGFVIQGMFHPGGATGSFERLGAYRESFAGMLDAATDGSDSPFSGVHTLTGNSLSPTVFLPLEGAKVIVGPSGRFVITAFARSARPEDDTDIFTRLWSAGASGQLDSAGHGTFASSGGLQGELWMAEGQRPRATVSPPGPGEPIVLESPHHSLVNLSTRGWVADSENSLISGFVIAGPGSARVLIRAIGPSLEDFDVQGVVADPNIELIRMSDHATIAVSDNWGQAGNTAELIEATARAGAFPVSEGSKDAAILVELPAGSYSAVTSGIAGASGTGLTEVYIVKDGINRTGRVVNLSTRGLVGAGDELIIPGFTIDGNSRGSFLIRAVGPSLADHGVTNPLSDPVLTIHSHATGAPLAGNDDWDVGDAGEALVGLSEHVGAFPLKRGSRDAALFFTAAPNTGYTAVVSGKDGANGVVLVEIYEY